MSNWYLQEFTCSAPPLSSTFSSNPPLFDTFLLAAGVFALEILLHVAMETGMFIGARMVAALWEHGWIRDSALAVMPIIMTNLELDGRRPLND